MAFDTVHDVISGLGKYGYLVDKRSATVIFLAIQMIKPVLVEGPAGVGKTELAKVLARALGRKLIRLQCYEGLDEGKALYEWNYQKQLLRIQANHAGDWQQTRQGIYSEEFLLPRPVLLALTSKDPALLLIDEVDKSDEEFESFLLETLSEYQVTISELGTVKALLEPLVVITSNSTRELGDALKRRCLYLYMDYPDYTRELSIIRTRLPHISSELAEQVVAFVQSVRRHDLKKAPSIAETLDWANSLTLLRCDALDSHSVTDTLAVLLKNQEDVSKIEKKLSAMLPVKVQKQPS
ncbi:ATPase [Clostridiales bacterium PH28_bin88]|nr:ATPase [Clostridiales bacterium PH28_bin88]